jgi:hypothetical protein
MGICLDFTWDIWPLPIAWYSVLNFVGHVGKGTAVLQDDAVSEFSWTFVLSPYSMLEDYDSNS